MDQIRQQVRRARLRLLCDRILRFVTWTTFAAMVLALFGIVASKIWPLGVSDEFLSRFLWSAAWVGGALVVGLSAGILGAALRQRGELDAAIEIDLRYGLKERVSSAVSLSPDEVKSEVGQALLKDAERRVARIDMSEHFRSQTGWRPLLPVLTALVALLLAFLPNAADDAAASTSERDKKHIRNSFEELKKRLKEQRKKAEAKGLKDADTVITKIERAVDELSREDADRKKTLIKLNNLTKQLAERRKDVEVSKKTRDMLKQLSNPQRGPAQRAAEALKKGDMDKAMDELKKLGDKLRSDELTAEEQKKLAQQLEQLKKELENMLGARQELADKKRELQDQINQLKKEGRHAEAGQLQDKIDQLQEQLDALDQQNPQLNQLQQLADKLGECAQCMKQGNGQKAADQLDKIASELQQMQEQLDSLQSLDEIMSEIASAKSSMSCSKCDGKGCSACQGMGMGGDMFSEKPGRGMGHGQGYGDRPEEKTDTGGFRARVEGNPQKGEAIRVGDADGPNVAGQSRELVKEEIASTFSQPPAPMKNQHLPRREREHSREYFELLREGD